MRTLFKWKLFTKKKLVQSFNGSFKASETNVRRENNLDQKEEGFDETKFWKEMMTNSFSPEDYRKTFRNINLQHRNQPTIERLMRHTETFNCGLVFIGSSINRIRQMKTEHF